MVKTKAQQMEELFERLIKVTLGDVLPILEEYIELKNKKEEGGSLPPEKKKEDIRSQSAPPF